MQNGGVTYVPGAYDFHLAFRLNDTELLFKTCLDPLGTVGFSRSTTMCNERCDDVLNLLSKWNEENENYTNADEGEQQTLDLNGENHGIISQLSQ